jgi:ABC-type transporter Mla subunit MlaD
MYESPRDTSAQLQEFLRVLAAHRSMLEQQREDLEITLAEIATHEAQCKKLLEATGDTKQARGSRSTWKKPQH